MLLFIPRVGVSQTASYLEGSLIIKYKADQELQKIRSQSAADPEEDIRRLLQQAGATSMQPVWNAQRQPRLLSGSAIASVQQAQRNLEGVFEVTYTSDIDAAVLAAKMEKLAGIAYAEPRYIRYMQLAPDDPVTNPYSELHNFIDAWDITTGSPEVVIAIVDGGVNYLHFDLDEKIWINTAEVAPAVRAQVDQNGDGVITSPEVRAFLERNGTDYNGDGAITLADAVAAGSPLLTNADTDGNGFTDDIYGWDFWASGGVNGQPITQDNNPIADGTDHGAHVAGIAAAETNNGAGIASAGFNVRYMALKAGGIPDDPATRDDDSRAIGFGFESIIYAAIHGADVINCSFGGGGFSEFENDVINFATDMGSVVVAASGNAGANTVDFPAGYANALAVGSVDDSGQISSFSNVGYNLDVFATGSSIQSTGFDNDIVVKSGTSMSTPVAAGLAGLVKSLHPEWTPQRIATQLRASSRYINQRNNRFGHGVLDAENALATDLPGIRITDFAFQDGNGEKLGVAEEGTLTLELTNHGASTSGVRLLLESLVGQGVTITQPSTTIGSLPTGAQTEVVFSITFSASYDLTIVPAFRLNISSNATGYSDFNIVQYDDILFDIMDANNIQMSFGGDGTIGYIDAFAAQGGVGFVPLLDDTPTFTQAENALFEGGLMVEAEGVVFDAVRGDGNQILKDFIPIQPFTVSRTGATAEQQGAALFSFGDEAGNAAGEIALRTYAYNSPERRNVVYAQYSLTNSSVSLPLNDIYLGLFNDWDIGANISNNDISYSAQDSILYISSGFDTENDPIIAVAHLSPVSSALAINNFPSGNGEESIINISDGFSDTEKATALKAGTQQTSVTSADVSAVTASGPYILNPEATLTTGFVYAFGNDLEELRAQIQAARQDVPFRVSPTGVIISKAIPEETELLQNAPNPFWDETVIRLKLSEDTDVKLVVYDVLGRKVDVLRDERMRANDYFIPFVPQNLSSGVYFVRLETDETMQTISITYIK